MVIGSVVVVLAMGAVGLWPEGDLPPVAIRAQRDATGPPEPTPVLASNAITDTDTEALDRILVEDREETPVQPVEPASAEQREEYAAWIRDLAHDDIRWNARDALGELRNEPAAAPQLEEALDSPDLQQRRLAAFALTGLGQPGSRRLAEVLVDAMRREVERELYGTITTSSASAATRYLYHHPEGAYAVVRRAAYNGDEQQRYLCTFLLGCWGSEADLPHIVGPLVARLEDNDTQGDAMMSAHALYRLGPEVIAPLRGWRGHVDQQARQLIDLIVLDLESPPRTRTELEARKSMHNVTALYYDPVIEWNISRSRLAWR